MLEAAGVICEVIAPSRTPVTPGCRIKTDRRDARKLAELLRADVLTRVHAPHEADEALRDLCRCRDDVRVDLRRARHRLTKLLLRRQCIDRDTRHHWGTRHRAWLAQLRFGDSVSQATFDSFMLAVQRLEERQRQLDLQLEHYGNRDPYREPVGWLRCFKGIDTVTAVSLIAELHDFRRFRSARESLVLRGTGPERELDGAARAAGLDQKDRQPARPATPGGQPAEGVGHRRPPPWP